MTGLIHLYWGDGKGKTSAALGLALRAAGAGMKVLFVQFLKDGSSPEMALLDRLGMETACCPDIRKFVFQMTEEERRQAGAEYSHLLSSALRRCRAVGFGLLVLDEIVPGPGLGGGADGFPPQQARRTGSGPHRPGALPRPAGAGGLFHGNEETQAPL